MSTGLSIVIGTGAAGRAGVARFVSLASPSYMALGPYVLDRSLRIDKVLSRKGDTATMTVRDVGNQLSIGRFSKIKVLDDVGNSLFTGWVTKIREKPTSAVFRDYELTCQDATYFLTSRIHNKVYTNSHVTDIAIDMVTNPSNGSVGITATPAHTPPATGVQLPYFRVNRGIISNELDRLAKIASVGTIWDWYIDDTQDLHFFYAAQAPAAPIVLTDAVPAQSNQFNYLRDTFYYEVDDSQLGNNVTVRGATYLSSAYTQTWVSNGSQTAFPLDYAPDVTAAATFPTITVGGSSETIALDQGQTATTQWLVSQDAVSKGWVIKIGNRSGVPANTTVITTVYQFDLPVLTQSKNWNQVSLLKNLPNQGVFDRYIVDQSITSKAHAHQRATAELSMYGQSYINAHADIPNVSTGAVIGTMRPGQLVPVINAQLGVNTSLLIVKSVITAPGPTLWSYAIDMQG